MREDQLEPLEVQARFVAVLFQRFAQFRRPRRFGETRQRPNHLCFGVIQVTKLVEVQILQRRDGHLGFSWVSGTGEAFTQVPCLRDRARVQMRYSRRRMADGHPSEAGLVRAIGARQLTASIINITIGAGIFVLPAAAAAGLGAAAPIAYIVCAVLMALIVCCFAAAGSRVSLTGGLYAYVEVAFGPFVGFLAGVLYFLMATLRGRVGGERLRRLGRRAVAGRRRAGRPRAC